MPRHSHPIVQEIDAAFDTLDPIFDAFTVAHSYELYKSIDGDFLPPHRQLTRIPRRPGLSYCVDFRVYRPSDAISLVPFSPDLPCSLKVLASALVDDQYWKCFREDMFPQVPFRIMKNELGRFLQQAHLKLNEWPHERLLHEGFVERV